MREVDASPAGEVTESAPTPSRPEPDLVIRPYSSAESVVELTQLIREAYGVLAELGFRYLGTHQNEVMTARRLGRGFPLVAYLDRQLVGTVTLFPARPDSPVPWYRRPEVVYFGQFGVKSDLQKSGIGSALLREVERRARDRGAGELACDTAEGAEHLRRWYDKEGFRFIDHMQWAITNYRSVVLSKTL